MVDATYLKVRVDHRICPMTLMIAMGMTRDAMKELIGFRLKACESRKTWGRFLSSLRARGLSGSSMFTSDAHEGLVFWAAGGLPRLSPGSAARRTSRATSPTRPPSGCGRGCA
ncbi:MAG: hypothetical protein DUD39_01225 [Coriobacteriaceae bacterium]|nr:MAG: hypothetical protein DUD39_01225 [Coriobacteriaceae bacterium]